MQILSNYKGFRPIHPSMLRSNIISSVLPPRIPPFPEGPEGIMLCFPLLSRTTSQSPLMCNYLLLHLFCSPDDKDRKNISFRIASPTLAP